MKYPIILTVVLALVAGTAFGQSDSFNSLRSHFKGKQNVETFSIGGFFVNLVLQFAEDEDWDMDAFQNMGGMHLISIPKQHFQTAGLSLDSYRRYIRKQDGYEPLLEVKEKGERVSIYIKEMKGKQNRYLMLIDDDSEVTAIEFKGYVDVERLAKNCNKQPASI